MTINDENGAILQFPEDDGRQTQRTTYLPNEIGKLGHIAKPPLSDKDVIQFHSPGDGPAAEWQRLRKCLWTEPWHEYTRGPRRVKPAATG